MAAIVEARTPSGWAIRALTMCRWPTRSVGACGFMVSLGDDMRTVAHFRHRTEERRALVSQMSADESRERLLAVARAWDALANEGAGRPELGGEVGEDVPASSHEASSSDNAG